MGHAAEVQRMNESLNFPSRQINALARNVLRHTRLIDSTGQTMAMRAQGKGHIKVFAAQSCAAFDTCEAVLEARPLPGHMNVCVAGARRHAGL